MPRTDITTTKLGKMADVDATTGTTIDATLVTNGIRLIALRPKHVVLRISNTAAAAHAVTIVKASKAQSAEIKKLDGTDWRTDFATTQIPLTSGVRTLAGIPGEYVQEDGSIYINLETGHTGLFQAYEVPAS